MTCNENAGNQGNSIPASCSQSEIIVIVVTLPMTKSVFIANEDMYIASVAVTAGVLRENVKILSIDEVSTRSSRIITGRLLLAASVRVQTSVQIAAGQQTNIKDQTVLNSNLNKNGLPSGTLVVQYNYVSGVSITTPAPGTGGSDPGASNAASSNVPLGAVVGGAVGFSVLLAGSILALRWRKKHVVRSTVFAPLLLKRKINYVGDS